MTFSTMTFSQHDPALLSWLICYATRCHSADRHKSFDRMSSSHIFIWKRYFLARYKSFSIFLSSPSFPIPVWYYTNNNKAELDVTACSAFAFAWVRLLGSDDGTELKILNRFINFISSEPILLRAENWSFVYIGEVYRGNTRIPHLPWPIETILSVSCS
jgi:hypothetical protein